MSNILNKCNKLLTNLCKKQLCKKQPAKLIDEKALVQDKFKFHKTSIIIRIN